MIKFFRKTRQNLLMENKTAKYFKYAIGEIVLVVIGIIIALQINNWNEKQKKTQIKQNYINNLITDLTKDTIQLNERLKLNQEYIANIDSSLAIVKDTTLPLSAIYNLAKANPNTSLRVINSYNNNTFNVLISTGNIDFFSNDFRNELMELNRLQTAESSVTQGNSGSYFDLLTAFSSQYVFFSDVINPKLQAQLWKNTNQNQVISIFINLKTLQLHAVNRYIELTKVVFKKTEIVLNQLKTSTDI